jgi:RHS repeat-associated protein
MYQSQICDWESGKYYWKYRYYDTSTGRWLSRDLIAEQGGMNLYGFVGNGPVNRADPFGLLGIDPDSNSGGLNSPPVLTLQRPLQNVPLPPYPLQILSAYAGCGLPFYGNPSGLQPIQVTDLLMGLGASGLADSGGGERLLDFNLNAIGTFLPMPLLSDVKMCPTLRRPYIRNWVREEVEASALRAPDGRFIDPYTRMPTDRPIFGHKPGYEFWRLKQAAEAEGVSQELFNESLNNPEFYEIQDYWENASHAHELP